MPALRFVACLLAGLLLVEAASAVPVYRIGRIFTTLDGNSQFVLVRAMEDPDGTAKPVTSMRIRDSSGSLFAGFPISLPAPAVAGSTFVVAFDPVCGLACDYVPYGDSLADYVADKMLLPIGGGTIELAGADGVADAWTFPAPPVDGATMLDRVTGVMEAVFFSRLAPPRAVDIPFLLAFEYQHDSGSYFLATRADERVALDQGRIAGWLRTNHAHWVLGRASRNAVLDAPGPRTVPVCRVLLGGATGVAHFMSAIASECETLRATGAVVESEAIFHAALPDPVTGACPDVVVDTESKGAVIVHTHPVMRFWDGKSAPPRHRLVSTWDVRDDMLADGWIAEGFGPGAVALCF